MIRVMTREYDAIEFPDGKIWVEQDSGSLVVKDNNLVGVARFAKGVWAYVMTVEEE